MKKILVVSLFCIASLLLFSNGCFNASPKQENQSASLQDGLETSSKDPIVILISIDGYRADYLDMYTSPNLSQLAVDGVRAKSLIPSHPTKTVPNHYTIVTGLYPSNHGIVANTMYDPVFDETFSLSKREEVENARWWGGEPLWVTAEQQGVRAGTFFWPGSAAPIKDTRPTFWKRYDGSVPGNTRVDEVLSWLDLEEAMRPRFITLYFSDVDSQGHQHGIDSEAVESAISRVDRYLGRLFKGVADRKLTDRVNYIIVSDHGMVNTSEEKIIFLDDYVNRSDFYLTESSPIAMMNTKNGKFDEVFDGLKGAHSAMKVYHASDYPTNWHWNNHRRIPQMVAVADEGWSIVSSREAYLNGDETIPGGTHGYDRFLPSMQALFVAQGPAFKEGATVAAFENIHIYPLITHLLNLEPAKTDGSFDAVHHLLK